MRFIQTLRLFAIACLLSACVHHSSVAAENKFGVLYTVKLQPDTHSASVEVKLTHHSALVRKLDFAWDPKRYQNVTGSGELSAENGRVVWTPPASNAWLRYEVTLTSRRKNGEYDGYVTQDWALFRADDLVPPVLSRFARNSTAESTLVFQLPEDWSVATRYPRDANGRFLINDPDRKFDRPTGWLVMGKIGVRRTTTGNTKIAVAAPQGKDVRYLDTLAFLRTTVPHLQAVFTDFPERLLLVSAGDPMWRGALSAPNSMYVHADRPMISGNATSTFLHELVHIAMSARSAPGADGIVEGLAEYYSLETLRRADAISQERFEKAHRELAEWGQDVDNIEVDRAHGSITAKAVSILRNIDQKIRQKSSGKHSLDDVANALAMDEGPVTLKRFQSLVEQYSRQ